MKLISVALLGILCSAMLAFAGPKSASEAVSNGSPAVSSAEPNPDWMLEGQKRYATNCGRCHQAPHKFSPREMAMAVRHMRVRAMLTQADMNYVVYFMTHQ